MGDSSGNFSGFHSRAEVLLNSKKFSDVEIQVINGKTQKTFQAHKLILAMSSPQFEDMFYGSSESPKVLKIFDYPPEIVYLMLKYLYTDKTDFIGNNSARNVYRLAKKYSIKDLEIVCIAYLSKDNMNFENIIEKYEFALLEDIPLALRSCRNYVSAHTIAVLQSPQFTEASQSVVEDILKLDIMSVKSELDVIEYAIKWAKQEYLRRGTYTESLRICLYPLFKHLRFLTLSAPEFCDFVERYDNILNAHESNMLTMCILQPSSVIRLPSGFCLESISREFPKPDVMKNIGSAANKGSDKTNALDENNLDGDGLKPSVNNRKFDFELALKEHLRGNYGLNKPTENKFESKVQDSKTVLETSIGSSTETKDFVFKYKSLGLRDNEYDDKPVVSAAENQNFRLESNKQYSVSQTYKRQDSGPTYTRKQSPMLKVSPQILMNQRRSFEFPLQGMSLTPTTAFPNDIMCSATVHLHKGAIEIYGIELKIQEKLNSGEDIKVYLSLNGSEYSSKNFEYEEKLINGVYPLVFHQPIKLLQNNHIKIEVLVEDLILNRCSGCNSSQCELNYGLGVMAQINLKSNQYDDNKDLFFLISRLLYKPC